MTVSRQMRGSVGESGVGASRDLITDYVHGQDKLGLTQTGAKSFIGTSDFSGAAGQVNYFAGDGVTVVRLDADGDRTVDFEVQLNGLLTLDSLDFVDLPNGALRLVGTGGADTLRGVEGNDVPIGLAGNDLLEGGAGADKLEGRGGDDVLVGGRDYDTLFGGAGNDVFVLGAAIETAIGMGRDEVYDFARGDKIDLSGIDAVTGTAAKDAFTLYRRRRVQQRRRSAALLP